MKYCSIIGIKEIYKTNVEKAIQMKQSKLFLVVDHSKFIQCFCTLSKFF